MNHRSIPSLELEGFSSATELGLKNSALCVLKKETSVIILFPDMPSMMSFEDCGRRRPHN